MGDDDAAIDEKSLSTNDKEEQSLGKIENCFSSLAHPSVASALFSRNNWHRVATRHGCVFCWTLHQATTSHSSANLPSYKKTKKITNICAEQRHCHFLCRDSFFCTILAQWSISGEVVGAAGLLSPLLSAQLSISTICRTIIFIITAAKQE